MTLTAQRAKGSRFDRFVAWLLDPDGVMYGDEQERLRYYEGTAVIASAQWVLVPWVLAAAAWFGGRGAAIWSLAAAVVFFVPMVIGSTYVQRRRVRRPPVTRVFVVLSVLMYLPYPLLLLGFLDSVLQGQGGSPRNGIIGGVLGGLAGWLVAVLVIAGLRSWRRRRPAPATPDLADDE